MAGGWWSLGSRLRSAGYRLLTIAASSAAWTRLRSCRSPIRTSLLRLDRAPRGPSRRPVPPTECTPERRPSQALKTQDVVVSCRMQPLHVAAARICVEIRPWPVHGRWSGCGWVVDEGPRAPADERRAAWWTRPRAAGTSLERNVSSILPPVARPVLPNILGRDRKLGEGRRERRERRRWPALAALGVTRCGPGTSHAHSAGDRGRGGACWGRRFRLTRRVARVSCLPSSPRILGRNQMPRSGAAGSSSQVRIFRVRAGSAAPSSAPCRATADRWTCASGSTSTDATAAGSRSERGPRLSGRPAPSCPSSAPCPEDRRVRS